MMRVKTRRLAGTLVRASLVLSVSVVLFAPSKVAASPEYPSELQRVAAIPCVPGCTLCHADSGGGSGTVIKPFGRAVSAQGLSAQDESQLMPALRALGEQNVDSDGDGVADVVELDEGQDPNLQGDVSVCGPEFGCARIEPVGNLRHGGIMAIVLALVLSARVRRRPSVPKQ
jgi:hypothetical protein